jgi:hypothetical protein
MPAAYRERGASLLGTIIFLLMAGFFELCAIRMFPVYFEYLSVRSIVEGIVETYDPESMGVADIRRSIDSQFNTNQIYAIKPRDVEVYRREGETHIDASYEVRVPIAGRFDAVLKFDDLNYVAGRPGD